MLDASIYHKASADSVGSILTDGLRCSRRGSGHDDPRVRQTNDLLDALRPDRLRAHGVDRNACTYCYLTVDDLVFDVDSGLLVPEPDWLAEVGNAGGSAALRLTADPDIAYVSDLEAYDELAERIGDAPQSTVQKLARRYWERIVALPDLCRYYERTDHALVRHPDAPVRLPSRLERVEVLLTADVPADRIARTS